MAALAATVFSEYPTDRSFTTYSSGKGERQVVQKSLKISACDAADTATAAVMGFDKVLDVGNAWDATDSAVIPIALDPVNNRIVIGAGPTANVLYLTVVGIPTHY